MKAILDTKVLFLLSGPIAVGKTSVRDVLTTAYGFAPIRSSAYLRSLAIKRGLADRRNSLQELGDKLDRDTDFRWLVDEVTLPQIQMNPKQSKWLVDAVRKERQVHHFRELFGASVLHVHLTAADMVLRERYEARAAFLDDPTPYSAACEHVNENASRQLVEIADFVIDTSYLTPSEVIQRNLSGTLQMTCKS